MHPDPETVFIQNSESGEGMKLREDRGAHVFDVIFEDDGETGKVMLDPGTGVSVCPRGLMKQVPLRQKQVGLRMIAAKGPNLKMRDR